MTEGQAANSDNVKPLPMAQLSDTDIFRLVQAKMLELRISRNRKYADSWRQYGTSGVLHDILKKADRLRGLTCVRLDVGPTGSQEFMLKAESVTGRILDDIAGEASVYDCLRDLHVYSGLMMTMFWRRHGGDPNRPKARIPSVEELKAAGVDVDNLPSADYTCPACQSGIHFPVGIAMATCPTCRAIFPRHALDKEAKGEGAEGLQVPPMRPPSEVAGDA